MSPLNNKTILIVEDEDDLREGLRFELELSGAQVIDTNGGWKAIEILKSNSVDLVLSDIRMPEGDGIELLEKSKTLNTPHPLFILITGFSDFSTKDTSSNNVAAVIAKPFDPENLVQIILNVLESKKAV